MFRRKMNLLTLLSWRNNSSCYFVCDGISHVVSGCPPVCLKNVLADVADVADALEELKKVSPLLPDHSVIGCFGM